MTAPDDPGAALPLISFDDFCRVDVRVGTVVRAEPYPEARKPALKLWIDFGPAVGEKRTHYRPETLVGRQVAAVVNFSPRQIGKFVSEVLVLGFRTRPARWCWSRRHVPSPTAAGCTERQLAAPARPGI